MNAKRFSTSSRPSRLTALLLGVIVCAVFLVPTLAYAQGQIRGSNFRETTIEDETLLQQGRMEILIHSAGLYSSDSGGDGAGNDVTSSSLYMNPSAGFGYMVTDDVQARASLGWLMMSTTANDVTLQNFNSGVGTLQGLYYLALPYGTALYGGLGAGYFYGSTTRPGPDDGTTISNPTSGFLGQLIAGWLIQPGPRFVMRAGLRLDTLFSSETPQTGGESISATNIKMVGKFGIGLRF